MKSYRIILAAAAILAATTSCSDKAQIKGTLTDAPETEVIVKQLNASSLDQIDTIKTDAAGKYSYKVDVKAGQPQFVYIFKGDTKVASLLLQKGDKVSVVSDTLGTYTVEGSEESAKLQEVENEFADFMKQMDAAAAAGDNVELSKKYVDYYRSRVKFVMENSKSLVSIPVLYQKINSNFPVFSQSTDALHFRTVYDSLMTVYPESKYVAALGKEAESRCDKLSFGLQMQSATEMSFPDLDLPSMDGANVKLSDVDAKVILVYFWTATDANQKMFNQDVLLPVYNDYHSRGFEIYSVSLDADKGVWASAVNSQKLPWINLCEGLGSLSKAAVAYNVSNLLPVAYVIANGQLLNETIQNETQLRRVIAANL